MLLGEIMRTAFGSIKLFSFFFLDGAGGAWVLPASWGCWCGGDLEGLRPPSDSCQPPVPEGMRGASVPESAVGCEERSLQRDGGCDPK